MLLSMCASYLWARLGKKAYIPMITIFVVLVSFCSAYFPTSDTIFIIFWAYLPFSFLSFPFYNVVDEVWVSPIYEVYVHRIRFLTVDIAPPYSMRGWIDMQSITNFSFFLLVNVLGALLGYWIGKKLKMELFGSRLWTVFFGLVGISSIGLSFLLAGLGDIGEIACTTFFGFGTFLFEAIFLSKTWRIILLVPD